MRRAWAWWLGAALAIAGCGDRHAGTETGNPEIIVTARFVIYEYGKSRTTDLHFLIMGMGYAIDRPSGAPDSGKCWNRPGGTPANFAALGSLPLPDTVIEDLGPWQQAEIILRAPDGPAGIPDSVDIGTWTNPRYAKFDLFSPEGTRKALFEMPQGAEYRLRFGSASVEDWRFRDSVWIPFFFNAGKWTDTLASLPAPVPRLDGRNAPYLLFSPDENAAGWQALRARLPESFYADTVIVR